jgi:hypothetical protein
MIESFCHGTAECLECNHKWYAVWPLGANALECPKCNGVETDRTQFDEDAPSLSAQ